MEMSLFSVKGHFVFVEKALFSKNSPLLFNKNGTIVPFSRLRKSFPGNTFFEGENNAFYVL